MADEFDVTTCQEMLVDHAFTVPARGAMTHRVSRLHSHYHIPISNTATGLLLLENRAAA